MKGNTIDSRRLLLEYYEINTNTINKNNSTPMECKRNAKNCKNTVKK